MMPDTELTRIVCIMPRLGTSVGGGKINAIFRRMNLLAERDNTEVVLLGLEHSVNQKVAFAKLRKNQLLNPKIVHRSLFEFCIPPDLVLPPRTRARLPDWDQQIAKGGLKKRISYFKGDTAVMRDTLEQTAAGLLTVRQIFDDPEKEVRLKYLGDELIEGVARFGDGLVHKTHYVNDKAVFQSRFENKSFRFADSAVTSKRYFNEVALQKDLVAQAFPTECVVFVDGITSVYLSQHIQAKKVLFLHANHRSPDGEVLRRPRYMIENFQGDAIVTATRVHKECLETDIAPSCRIDVIPHYAEIPQFKPKSRSDICTVSRLRLIDKPIHQCIEAFARVMHLIPDCNYLIYGSGPDEARLSQLIKHRQCEDRVFLMGHTSDPGSVFASSLMSLAPTMTEGFGLALLESLTYGCPVVSYDVDYGPRELIQPGQNGELLAPGDIDAIARAILKVHGAQTAYSAQSTKSALRYSYDVYRDNYLRLIDDVLKRPRFFDITSSDLKSETSKALETASKNQKKRLLDLFIKLCENSRDLEGMYSGFQEKLKLSPQVQRPLMRCIWLSRKLGRLDECKTHLKTFQRRFPENYGQFIKRYPDFLEIEDVAGSST